MLGLREHLNVWAVWAVCGQPHWWAEAELERGQESGKEILEEKNMAEVGGQLGKGGVDC